MKLSSYLKKLILLIKVKTIYRSNLITENLYAFNFSSDKKFKRVVFALEDSQFMHLGDYLFVLPVIKLFVDNGCPVVIYSVSAMRSVFRQLKLPVVEGTMEYFKGDLIISRFELISKYRQFSSIFIHVSQNLTMPICSQLLYEFGRVFHFNDYEPLNYDVLKDASVISRLSLPLNQLLIMFNPYCDASSYLITSEKRQRIIHFVTKILENMPNGVILLTGSEKDKLYDKRQYPFPYIDLRGKTSILDIFALVGAKNTVSYVGFDSFIMHVFSLYSKVSYAVFRGRISTKQSQMLKQFHVNLFSEHRWVHLICKK